MQADTAVPVGLAGPILSAITSGGLRSGNLRVYRGDYVLASDKIRNIYMHLEPHEAHQPM